MSLLLFTKPIYRPMRATQWVSDAVTKTKRVKKRVKKVDDEIPERLAPSIKEFIEQLSGSALAKLKKEEEKARAVQQSIWQKLQELKKRWQEEEEQLLTAFLFDLL